MIKVINICKDELKKIVAFLLKKIELEFIIIYGSSVTDNFREDSDIDLAYYSKTKVDPFELFILKEELADILRREVDLIDLKMASTVFKAQVVGTGEIIYCSDKNKLDNFRIRSLKEYALLNEERQIILDKIKEDGEIYGK
ncbi:nucleotidyltransferase domain-containing protein [bacterium AH-315-G05]|nr:nucleotidyltransferase domain-containing protein [bacterium AH-315-L21]MBN4069722.1 nucleotidyltransferase domain-containing protein [bacterium AH-315-G05]